MTRVPEIRAHQRFDLLMRFGRVEAHRPRHLLLKLVREDIGVTAVLHVQHRPDSQRNSSASSSRSLSMRPREAKASGASVRSSRMAAMSRNPPGAFLRSGSSWYRVSLNVS